MRPTGWTLSSVVHALDIINPEGFQNCIIGSKVTAILPDGWILPIGGVESGRVCDQRLVLGISRVEEEETLLGLEET